MWIYIYVYDTHNCSVCMVHYVHVYNVSIGVWVCVCACLCAAIIRMFRPLANSTLYSLQQRNGTAAESEHIYAHTRKLIIRLFSRLRMNRSSAEGRLYTIIIMIIIIVILVGTYIIHFIFIFALFPSGIYFEYY